MSVLDPLPGESEDQRLERVRRIIAEEQRKQSNLGAMQRGAFRPSKYDPPETKR